VTTKTDRAETIVQVLILILIAGMAGAASFTHVHDWTMHNAPAGTGSWFGWANAVISELTPTAAGIEIRRRKRHHKNKSTAYPMTVLIADAILSLSAQVAEAKPTPAGWISSAVPALAFLALTKLVLSSAPAPDTNEQSSDGEPVSEPASPPVHAYPALGVPDILRPVPTGHLITSARMVAFNHQQATGHPITTDILAERLGVPPALAESLIDTITGASPPPVTALNGTAHGESRP
jgi:hypothetical protein